MCVVIDNHNTGGLRKMQKRQVGTCHWMINAGEKKEQLSEGSINFLISAESVFCIKNQRMPAFLRNEKRNNLRRL